MTLRWAPRAESPRPRAGPRAGLSPPASNTTRACLMSSACGNDDHDEEDQHDREDRREAGQEAHQPGQAEEAAARQANPQPDLRARVLHPPRAAWLRARELAACRARADGGLTPSAR